MHGFAFVLIVVASCAVLAAQEGSNPLITTSKATYTSIKDNVLRSAEKVPEEDYAFRPAPEVRTFGQLLGHIADAQYLFCGAVRNGKGERKGIEKTATTKAALVEALKEAFAYCDATYSKLTDANAAQMTTLFGRQLTKLGVMDFNTAHTDEHYGNLVTYMRMKNIVPPSSEKRR